MQEKIKNQARELFFKYGIKSVTMEDIAKEVGISKKTLYQYYADKRTLVEIITEMVLDEKYCQSLSIQASARDALDELLLSTHLMREMLSRMNSTFFFDLKRSYHRAFEKVRMHFKRLYEIIRQNLQKGIKEGLFRPEINIEVASRLRLVAIGAVFNEDAFPSGQFSALEIQLESIDLFIRGIVTEKGLLKYQELK